LNPFSVSPSLDHTFLHAMRLNLSRVIGPMAESIDDVMAEMGLSPSHIPADRMKSSTASRWRSRKKRARSVQKIDDPHSEQSQT
jgi:hypothetical protein